MLFCQPKNSSSRPARIGNEKRQDFLHIYRAWKGEAGQPAQTVIKNTVSKKKFREMMDEMLAYSKKMEDKFKEFDDEFQTKDAEELRQEFDELSKKQHEFWKEALEKQKEANLEFDAPNNDVVIVNGLPDEVPCVPSSEELAAIIQEEKEQEKLEGEPVGEDWDEGDIFPDDEDVIRTPAGRNLSNLFRGLVAGKDWVAGDLVTVFGGTKILCAGPNHSIHLYDVEEKSVGQATGLKDHDGKDIYEGDIVRRKDGRAFSVCFAEERGGFVLANLATPEIIEPGLSKSKNLVVVGNTMEGISKGVASLWEP